MIRKGKQETKLGDVIELSPSAPKLNDNTDVTFLGMTDVSKDGHIIKNEGKKYSDVRSGFTSFKNNDVLVAKITPCFENGKGALVANMINGIGFGSTEFHVLRPSNKIDPYYLLSITQSHPFRMLGETEMTGSAGQKRVPSEFIRSYKIYLPSLAEQKKIAAILHTWDDAIENVQSLILKKKKFLAWVRKDICTSRQRLNGHTDKWEKIQSKDVLIEHKHKSTGNERVHSVSVHKGVIDQVEHLGRSFAAENKEKYNLVHYGDIIYTKSPTGDFPWGIIKQSRKNEDLIVSPLYGVFTPVSFDIGVILDFLFESYKYTSNYLNPLVQKGAKNTINITNSRFLEGHFYLPNSSAEAKEIANLIEACRNEIRILEFKLEKLKKQKRGLMQKLLAGAWPVMVSDKEAA